jgi:4-hydroxythreonine-4-phosphate dehydrogenase
MPILVGDEAVLRAVAGDSPASLVRITPEAGIPTARPGQENLYLYDVGAGGEMARPGKATAVGGRASAAYLHGALELIGRGAATAIVTAPISKDAWRMAGIGFPGHTEFLRDAGGSVRTAMMFLGGGMRVALFTTHVSIAEARAALQTDALAEFVSFVVEELGRFGLEHPKVAVAGFNPHAGEGGIFGDEEVNIIAPAVEMLRRQGLDVSGPLPADTLFSPHVISRFDLVVALYHDQGLIPVKALAFREAVNCTLGLPFVRTSPPHGVAFDIARSGKADSRGMTAAIRTAADLVRREREAQQA